MAPNNIKNKIQAGFLCYDLSPASASTLNRLVNNSLQIHIKAYPVLDTKPSTEIYFSYCSSSPHGKFWIFNTLNKDAPESMWFGIPWSTIRKLVAESDVVCFLGIQGIAALVAAIWAKICRKPFVTINQTMGPTAETKRHFAIRFTKGWILRNAIVNVAQTPPTIETLVNVYGIHRDQIEWAPWDGAAQEFHANLMQYRTFSRSNLRKKLNIPEYGFIIVFCGSLIYLKGIDILIRAFNILSTKDPNSSLYIIGPDGGADGKRNELEALTNELGLQNNVHFLGRQDWNIVTQYYFSSDVFVLPTRRDMWPKVLIEAAMTGLPLITTSTCGGAGYLVQDRVNGFVVPTDDYHQLAKALIKLLDKDLCHQMGESSKEIVKKYIEVTNEEVQGITSAIIKAWNLSNKMHMKE